MVVTKVKVVQLCPTLCDPMDYTVHGILQAKVLEWVAFPFSRGSSTTQGSNPALPHYRRILYQLSHNGSNTGQGSAKSHHSKQRLKGALLADRGQG